jgi:hypothetical protein
MSLEESVLVATMELTMTRRNIIEIGMVARDVAW